MNVYCKAPESTVILSDYMMLCCFHDTYRIEHSQDIVCLNDWILDMCWLNGDRDSVCKVAAVTAHNVVHIIECSGDAVKMTKYHCEVNCILYPNHSGFPAAYQ